MKMGRVTMRLGWIGAAVAAVLALAGCNGGGGSSNGTGTGASANQAPTQVMLVEASSVNAGSISASWLSASDDSTPATSLNYQLHASLDPAFTPSSSTKVFEGVGVTSASVSTLTAGQTYTVRLVALDAQGASTTSDPITVAVSATTATVLPGVQAQALPAAQVSNVTASSFDLPAAASAPAVGSFVTSTEANGGQGFLRKVLGVSTTGVVTTVQTAPAALNEVFDQLDLNSSVTLDAVPAPVAMAAEVRGQGRVLSRSAVGESTYQAYDWPGFSYQAGVGQSGSAQTQRAHALGAKVAAVTPGGAVKETATKSFTSAGNLTVTNTIDTYFAPKLNFRAKIGFASLQSMDFSVRASPYLVQTLDILATGAASLDSTQTIIAPRTFRQVINTPIPIVLKGDLALEMQIIGNASGAIKVKERLTIGYTDIIAGLNYQNGVVTPYTSNTPVYDLKVAGDGKATANLKIIVRPKVKLTGYEVLAGSLVLEPYLAAQAGIEGYLQMDAAVNFDQLQTTLAADADFRLTQAHFNGGINAYLMADLTLMDRTLWKYPKTANLSDHTTWRLEAILADTTLADLPQLSLSLPNGVGNGQNIAVTATATNTPNPLKATFPSLPDSFIPWQAWTAPRLIPPVGVTTGYSVSGSNGNYLVNVTEPGTYTLRVGGYSSWGSWARQYTEIPIVFGGTGFTKLDANGNALPDTATTWSCVRHNATGLLWEAHVTRQAPPHPCSWDPTQTCMGYTNYGDGSAYDASAVTGTVCGKPGRLPTMDEGMVLVNDPAYVAANTTRGAFQATWFGADDIAQWGWASPPVAGNPSLAWYVYFYSGSVSYYLRYYYSSNYGIGSSVRLVAP